MPVSRTARKAKIMVRTRAVRKGRAKVARKVSKAARKAMVQTSRTVSQIALRVVLIVRVVLYCMTFPPAKWMRVAAL